jgi:cytoskeletal protein CcmA (bactofilin family)
VNGSVVATKHLLSWGQAEIEGAFSGRDLRIGGYFKAQKAVATGEIEIAGQAETKEGMKADTILVRSGSGYKGVLDARKVDIGRSYAALSNWGGKFGGQSARFRLIGKETKVGDVYSSEVHMGRASRCGKIYSDIVEFEEGCIIEEITYTKEIRGPVDKVFLNRPFPKKVERLPAPPRL